MAKGKWYYMQSESLGQTIAYDYLSKWLFCQDGTRYSPTELEVITDGWTRSGEFPVQAHIIKKEFGGTVVFAERKK